MSPLLFNSIAHWGYPLVQSVIILIAYYRCRPVFPSTYPQKSPSPLFWLFHVSNLTFTLHTSSIQKKKIWSSTGGNQPPKWPGKLLLHYSQWPIFACSESAKDTQRYFNCLYTTLMAENLNAGWHKGTFEILCDTYGQELQQPISISCHGLLEDRAEVTGWRVVGNKTEMCPAHGQWRCGEQPIPSPDTTSSSSSSSSSSHHIIPAHHLLTYLPHLPDAERLFS